MLCPISKRAFRCMLWFRLRLLQSKKIQMLHEHKVVYVLSLFMSFKFSIVFAVSFSLIACGSSDSNNAYFPFPPNSLTRMQKTWNKFVREEDKFFSSLSNSYSALFFYQFYESCIVYENEADKPSPDLFAILSTNDKKKQNNTFIFQRKATEQKLYYFQASRSRGTIEQAVTLVLNSHPFRDTFSLRGEPDVRSKVRQVGDFYIYEEIRGNYSTRMIINQQTGQLVFAASTICLGNGVLHIPTAKNLRVQP